MFNREPQVALNDVPKVHHTLGCDLAIMLAAPAFGNSQGPPWLHNDRIIPEEGMFVSRCWWITSNEVILSISGVPRVYEESGTYNLTISLAHSTYIAGGYMIWDYGDGNFTPEMVRSTLKTPVEHYHTTTLEMIGRLFGRHQKVMLETYTSHLQET